MSIYYVYMYLREDLSPYYVGKGKLNRYKTKHCVPIPTEDRIVFVQTDMVEADAYELEKQLIDQYGRKNNGTGILRNLTEGGVGAFAKDYKPWNKGLKGSVRSEETKLKISEARKRAWDKVPKKPKPIKESSIHNRGGWNKGLTKLEHPNLRGGPPSNRYIWITNESESKRIERETTIPEGWRKGRVCKR